MARVTGDGIEGTSRGQYRARLEAAFQRAFGEDISLDSETPQGQMIGIFAQALSEVDDVIVSFGNATRLSTAYGDQLDSLGSLLQIHRLGATYSSVNVTFTGDPTTIDTGLMVNTRHGDLFTQEEPLVIRSGTTPVTVTMRALALGPADVPSFAEGAWQIRTPFTGNLRITGVAPVSEGRFSESDYAYRSRMRRTLARNALGGVAGIGAAVDAVDGVTRWRVDENTGVSRLVDGLTARANSVLVAARGGSDGTVARAIAGAKAPGVDTGFTAWPSRLIGAEPDTVAEIISASRQTFTGGPHGTPDEIAARSGDTLVANIGGASRTTAQLAGLSGQTTHDAIAVVVRDALRAHGDVPNDVDFTYEDGLYVLTGGAGYDGRLGNLPGDPPIAPGPDDAIADRLGFKSTAISAINPSMTLKMGTRTFTGGTPGTPDDIAAQSGDTLVANIGGASRTTAQLAGLSGQTTHDAIAVVIQDALRAVADVPDDVDFTWNGSAYVLTAGASASGRLGDPPIAPGTANQIADRLGFGSTDNPTTNDLTIGPLPSASDTALGDITAPVTEAEVAERIQAAIRSPANRVINDEAAHVTFTWDSDASRYVLDGTGKPDGALTATAFTVGALATAFGMSAGQSGLRFDSPEAVEYPVNGTTIRFMRVTEVPVEAEITIQQRPDFPSNGISAIKDAVKAEVDALSVGDGIDASVLYRAAYSVGGHTVHGTPTLTRKAGNVGVEDDDVKFHELLTLARDDVEVTIRQ